MSVDISEKAIGDSIGFLNSEADAARRNRQQILANTFTSLANQLDELRTTLTDTEAKLAEAKKGYERLAERLEITHVFQNIDGQKMVRVDVPRDQWEQQIDGIDCRNETIKLQDAAIERLQSQLAAAEARGLERAAQYVEGMTMGPDWGQREIAPAIRALITSPNAEPAGQGVGEIYSQDD